ncbi:MAG: ABC transporter substrate-binding protein [Alphaproteobacteria bacterium]|nr:MAG: ABC transporter substrate-binding protein [Alphaproteobacteria bacterium]TMK05212.1 MAG: ABC transporter substrate-binding protein [Alphaproteobacteria bacterium]
MIFAKAETYGRPEDAMPGFLRAFSIILIALWMAPASAAEELRVGKAVAFAWTFTPLDVGIQTGIFAKHGLEIEASAFNGDAKMQQGLTSDSIDVGIGGGPGMAFMVKGAPAKAVGAMAGIPRNMAVMVGYDSPIKTVDDLKGKKLGVTTAGSLTEWIGRRIGTQKGWGPAGITTVPIGGMPPARAAIKTNQIDGYITSQEIGISLEEAREWRVITSAAPFVDHFITHVFFVRDDVIAKRPQVVKAFLQGWQDTIAFMKNNKAKTVEITSKVTDVSHSVIERAYDEQIGIFSEDLTFDPEAMTVLKQSFIEMGLLKEIPDDKAMLTTQFLPVKAGK